MTDTPIFDATDITILRRYQKVLTEWSQDTERVPQYLREDLTRFLSWLPYMIEACEDYGREGIVYDGSLTAREIDAASGD